MTDTLIIIIGAVTIVLLIMILLVLLSPKEDKRSEKLEKSLRDGLSLTQREMRTELSGGMQTFS